MWNTFRTTSKRAVKYHDLQDGKRNTFGARNYDRLQWDVIVDFVLSFGRMARSNSPREHFFPGIPSLTWWTFHHIVSFMWLNWADPVGWHLCQISCTCATCLTRNAVVSCVISTHLFAGSWARKCVLLVVWLFGIIYINCIWLVHSRQNTFPVKFPFKVQHQHRTPPTLSLMTLGSLSY